MSKRWPKLIKENASPELISLERGLRLTTEQRIAARQFVVSTCSIRGIKLSAVATNVVVDYLVDWAKSFEVPS